MLEDRRRRGGVLRPLVLLGRLSEDPADHGIRDAPDAPGGPGRQLRESREGVAVGDTGGLLGDHLAPIRVFIDPSVGISNHPGRDRRPGGGRAGPLRGDAMTRKGPMEWRPTVPVFRQDKGITIFEESYKYYKGWVFEWMHPGVFAYHQMGGSLSVFFTPNHSKRGLIDIQVSNNDHGQVVDGEDVSYKGELEPYQLFEIVRPWLEKHGSW